MKFRATASKGALFSAASLAAIAMLGASAAHAQDVAAQGAENEDDAVIVVTGSRIPKFSSDNIEPLQVLDANQIESRGHTTIGKALQELPSFGVPGSTPIGDQAGSFGSGQSFVNFFGLGSQRTLTLVNSRRFIGSNTTSIFGPTDAGTQVDLNLIPALLVDRIETIAVGGAPIYGSDAIAGTINIILKKNFEGIALDGQAGISSRGDAGDYRIGGLFGKNFAEGRGNITVSAEYNKSEGLVYNDRDITRQGRFFTTPADPSSPFTNSLIFDRTIPGLSQFGIPLVSDFIALTDAQAADFGGYQPSVLNAAGQPMRFDASGNLIPIDFGTATGNLINFSGGNGFRISDVSALLSPIERIIGTAQLNYEIADNFRVFGEAWYARSKGTELIDQPVYNTALFDAAGTPDGNFIIPLSNPYLSPAARAVIQNAIATSASADDPAQDYFYLGRANTDLVSGRGSSTSEIYRFVLGFDGDIALGDNKLKWEVVGVYGRAKSIGESRELVQQNFENALNSVAGPGGTIICAPGSTNASIATISSTCAPINPFGQQISQAAKDYVTTIARVESVNTQKVITASLAGEVFNLPGGKVGMSVGYEHREESARFDPGTFFYGIPDPLDATAPRGQFGRSIPIDPVSGSYKTDELFGELSVPIVGPDMNVPLVNLLRAKGAVRWVNNSLAGKATTWTAGAEWRPIPDIAFRGNYTRSIRAPAITELFAPTGLIFDTADDPCDSRFINGGPVPATRAANCAAAGLPANFQSNIVDFTSQESVSGNVNLKNEVAKSWTIGAVLKPSFIPGFTASVDWVNIGLRNAVLSLDDDQLLKACYDAISFPSPACAQIDRDAAGQVVFVRTGYVNAASYDYKGLIAQVDYQLRTPFLGADSRVNLSFNYQYIDKLEQRVGTGDLTTLRNSIGYSKHKGTASLTYRNNGFTWLGQLQYFGPARIDPDEAITNRDFPGVGSVAFFNTTFAYDFNERFGVRLIVDNLFDTKPPFPSPAGGGTVTYFSGILGRYMKIGATAKF